MQQHETTKQKQARTYESFSEETKEAIRTINMGIGGRYRINENMMIDAVEYYNQWEGTWHFLRYLTVEERAYREFLNREVE